MNNTLHPVNIFPSQKASNASVHLVKVDRFEALASMSMFSPTPLLTDLRQRRNDIPTDHSPELRILPV